MTSKQIEKIILQNLADRSFPVYLTHYNNQGFNEADVLGISGSGVIYEYEIKVSRADYFAEFKNKIYKHNILNNRSAIRTLDERKKGIKTGNTYDLICIPNRYYFICPDNLIKKEELPEYAGLIYIYESGEIIEVKNAPILHHHKANDIIYKNVASILSQRCTWGCAYRTYKLRPNY